jgi:hypothetical protein
MRGSAKLQGPWLGLRIALARLRVPLAFVALAALGGCSDVGDSSAIGSSGTSSEEASFSGSVGPDATAGGLTGSDEVAASGMVASGASGSCSTTQMSANDAAADTDLGVSSGSSSSGTGSSGSAGPSGSGIAGSGQGSEPNAASAGGDGSGSPPEAGTSEDSSVTQLESGAGSNDAVAEARAQDSEADASSASDNEPDVQQIDSGSHQDASSQSDAGGSPEDGAVDASEPSPCTTSPCAAKGPNSVMCDGNTGTIAPANICTATEALLVERDIKNGNLTPTGQLKPYDSMTKTGSCYECMVYNDCIDNDLNGDNGKECGDVTVKTLDGEPGPQECIEAVDCMQSNQCDTANPPEACFCGTATGSSCLMPAAANGPCLDLEIDGLAVGSCSTTYPAAKTCTEGDPTASSKAYTDQTRPAGNANAMLGCAFSNCQELCTP